MRVLRLLVRVCRSLLLGWCPLSVDRLNVLQDLFESQLLLRVSSIYSPWNSLARQNLVQFIRRQILVHHLWIIVAKHSWPLSPWSLLWLLLSWVLEGVQVLEVVLARRRVEESRSWVVRWSTHSHSSWVIFIGIVIRRIIIIRLLILIAKGMANLIVDIVIFVFPWMIRMMGHAMRLVSMHRVLGRLLIVNVHQRGPHSAQLLIDRVLSPVIQ